MGAQDAAAVVHHEVHFIRRYLLRCNDKVAFIFTIFIIHDDQELTFLEVFQGFFNSIQLDFFHHYFI